MILRPFSAQRAEISDHDLVAGLKNVFISGHRSGSDCEPAWAAIARTQHAKADRYLLITQPDHARLAGELAAQFRADFLPARAASLANEIGVHDSGWLQFPAEADCQASPELDDHGLPRSFVNVPIEQSLKAWNGSIAAAAQVSPVGAYMVSGHFYRLAQGRLGANADPEEARNAIRSFVDTEEKRRTQLEPALRHFGSAPSQYVDLIQFCDALSLYLCCGTTACVEFPQRFGDLCVRIAWNDGIYATEPSLFADSSSPGTEALTFHVAARQFPSDESTQIEIRIR